MTSEILRGLSLDDGGGLRFRIGDRVSVESGINAGRRAVVISMNVEGDSYYGICFEGDENCEVGYRDCELRGT